MPKYGPFLPNIWENIYQILEKNNLTPDFYFTKENFYKTLKPQRFFITPVEDSNGNKYIFKARIEDYQETKEIFNREINFIKYINKEKISDLKIPCFIKSEKKPIEWILYEFVEKYSSGNILGPWERYEKNFPIDCALDLIFTLQKNTKNIIKDKIVGTIPIKNGDIFLKEFDDYSKNIQNLIDKNKLSKAREIIFKNKKLLNNSASVLVHGDFHPGNMIINSSNPPFSLVIIDWANIHINNYLYDAVFLWIIFSQYPYLQKKIIKHLTESHQIIKNFDILFKINLIRIIPQIIETLDYMQQFSKENFKQKIKNYINIFEKSV